MKLDKFILAGHSFGGYIVGNYALKYHMHIEKLQLISPIGIRVQPSTESWEDRLARRSENGNGPPKWVRPLVKYVWLKKLSPFEVGRFLGQRQCMKMIVGYVENRQKTNNCEEKQAIIDYMYQIVMREGTTEYAIHIMFNPGLQAHLPLGARDKLGSPEFPIPISFIYGDSDWTV